MLVAKKVIGSGDRKQYIVDYYNYLNLDEEISDFTAAPDDNTVVIDTISVAADGKSVSFFVTPGDNSTTFTVLFTMTSDISQVKEDHALWVVIDP